MTTVALIARRPIPRRLEPSFQFALRAAFIASAFVFFEPAPFDILIVCLLGVTLLRDDLRWPAGILVPALVLNFFLIGNVLSVAWAESVSRAVWYAGVTLYLVGSWFLLVALLTRYGTIAVRAIFSGYTVAAVISSLAALAAFFQVGPGRQFLTLYDRPKAFFKDPNVFGPFAVPIVLYAVLRFEAAKSARERLVWSGVFFLTSFAVLISFSRAAWINYVISLSVFLLLKNGFPIRFGTVSRLALILGAGAALLLALLQIPQVASFIPQRLGLQSYDSQRFATQSAALDEFTRAPLGIGPGQSESFYNHATHSLYLRVANENGVIGAIGFGVFLVLTVCRAVAGVVSGRSRNAGMAALFLAALIGVLVNSAVIDTLHWRHFWLLCALPWGGYEERAE